MGGNKPHKSRFATKSQQAQKSKGRAAPKGPARQGIKLSAAGNAPGQKIRRLQAGESKRENKRKKLLHERRTGTVRGAPKTVAFVGLSAMAAAEPLLARVLGEAPWGAEPPCLESDEKSWRQAVTCMYPKLGKARLSYLAAPNQLDRQVDVAKVADVVVLIIRAAHDDVISRATARSRKTVGTSVADGEEFDDAQSDITMTSEIPDVNQYGMCIDQVGQKFLSILQAVGLPTVIIAVVGMDEIPSARLRRQMFRLHTVYFRHFFPDHPRVFVCDTPAGVTSLVRHAAEVKLRTVQWREQLSYMAAENVTWEDAEGEEAPLLCVSGYLRGRPLSADTLIHLTHLGTFQLHSIRRSPDPCPLGPPAPPAVLHTPTKDAEPLAWIRDVDPMANEQTWPTEEELGEAPGDQPGSDSEGEDPAMDLGDDAASSKSRKSLRTEVQTQIDSLMATSLARLEKLTPEQREAERQHFEEQRRATMGQAGEDRTFPDELDGPIHIPARHRFLRYRGLSSFRQSKWDPMENLPLDYGRIYQFHNLRATQKQAWALFETMPVQPDQYVTLLLRVGPRPPMDAALGALRLGKGFLTACGLRRHEHKWSVMHYSLQFNARHAQPLKSKESVLIHVGFRIFRCNPIFSEPSLRSDKHKMMRFFHPADKFAVASAYGPVSYAPMPVLMFKTPELDALTADLVAWGSVLGANPNRIILKRVVLTGQAYKVHKRQAVIRFMFYNEKDVNWFKPVELFTKHGHAGRIMGPLGSHGHMKCQMSSVVHGEDTVCMALYKRVYPKWTTVPCSWLPDMERRYTVPSLEQHGPTTEDLDLPTAPAGQA